VTTRSTDALSAAVGAHAPVHYVWGNIGLTLPIYILIALALLWVFGVRRYSIRIAQVLIFGVVPVSLWIVQFEMLHRQDVGREYTINAFLVVASAIGWAIYQSTRTLRFITLKAIFWTVFSLSTLLQYFSYLYWNIGNKSNFNHPLSHLDALYFSIGTFTTAGTGKLAAESESAIRLQTVQMALDFAFLSVAVALLFIRFSIYMADRIGSQRQMTEVKGATAGADA
jgi:hypothetical protein